MTFKRSITILFTVLAILLVSAPSIYAQKGGGKGGQQSGQQGQNQGQQQGKRMQDQDRERNRIHVNDQQHRNLMNCINSADRLREHARMMKKAAGRSSMNAQIAQKNMQQLRNTMQTMEQEHSQLMNSLNDGQKAQLQDRISEMERLQDRIRTQLQEMDQECMKQNPDRERIQQQAREMEKATKEWQRQYRYLQSESSTDPAM